jgi:hypothetical protein
VKPASQKTNKPKNQQTNKPKRNTNMNGTHPNGNITYNAAAAVAKGQPVKFTGSTTTTGMPTVTPCAAATDAAIGVALEPANAGENVPVAILGNYTGTVEVLAGGAVSRGAQLGATGATAASGNTTIGMALDAATAEGQLIEVAHHAPGTAA